MILDIVLPASPAIEDADAAFFAAASAIRSDPFSSSFDMPAKSRRERLAMSSGRISNRAL